MGVQEDLDKKINSELEIQKGKILEEFKECDEIKGLIADLSNIYKDQIAVELTVERCLFIVDQYQEQPHLLDPHLESILGQLLDIVRKPDVEEQVLHLAFKIMYFFTKTRGYKVILRLMPHEVADLEPVLAMLGRQNPQDYQTWETRYMLLLWLSIVSMIPFDMVKLDSNAVDGDGNRRKPIMERIIDAGKMYLHVSDKSCDAAGYMLARFMTRVDVKRSQALPQFIDWALVSLSEEKIETSMSVNKASGILCTLARLFKDGKREDLLDYAGKVLERVLSLNLKDSQFSILRKMTTKMVQRLGLTFLKAKVAAWRYQRGNRSLLQSLGGEAGAPTGGGGEAMDTDDDDYDIPDELEEVIDYLLNALKDKDTIVRWSAAKGIGRVTGRLPMELANEVVGSIMEFFSIRETDMAWHGACLSLAELGRRGLLLPERLPDVVPVIVRALMYDEKRAMHSVGSHVRDAACYVCWAFARAYDPAHVQPYVDTVASALLIVAVFDREVNVRRAAAAAFQENVGRQGQFPHGIDIVTTCDYFAVGNRNYCYTNLSAYLGQYDEYTKPLIDHLVDIKTNHWHTEMRELASEGLHILTKFSPDYMRKTVLGKLVELCLSMDLNQRHGAILAAAEVAHSLSEVAAKDNKNLADVIEAKDMEGLKKLIKELESARLYRGMGGDVMRKASCVLIRRLSEAAMPLDNSTVIGEWQGLLDDCLTNIDPTIQEAARTALPAFFSRYYQTDNGKARADVQDEIISRYLGRLTDSMETTRIGYALAIGSFPKFMIQGKLRQILSALILCQESGLAKNMAESRRDTMKALAQLCLTVGGSEKGEPDEVVCAENVSDMFDALFKAIADCTIDSRGDVGAWVREAGMTGIGQVIGLLSKQAPALVTPEISGKLFMHLVQQAVEKIDRTREVAGQIFGEMLYHEPQIPGVPQREKLEEIFPKEKIGEVQWNVAEKTFPLFVRLLALPEYRYHVLLGLTVSVGGLTESTVKFSGNSLLNYLGQISRDHDALQTFFNTMLQVFRANSKVDRVTIPFFKMVDFIMSRGCLRLLADDPDNQLPVELFEQSKTEISKSGNIQKILASIDCFCGLLQFEGGIRKKCLIQLSIFMCYKFPIVRKTSASKLYESILMYDDIVEDDKMEDVMTLLSDTQWDKPVAGIRPIRNQVCEMMDIPVPKITTKAS